MRLKPTRTEKMIIKRVTAAINANRPVMVDQTRIQGIRFRNGEIEVDWWESPEDLWTVIQPCFLSSEDDEVLEGTLELNTY